MHGPAKTANQNAVPLAPPGRWITYHGLALNVVNSLEPFSDIVPCGISDRPVSSVLDTLNRKVFCAPAA